MTLVMMLNLGLMAVNGILSIVLGSVYVRNHRQLRSPFTRAMVLFAVFLVVHSSLSIYHALSMMATYTTQAELFLLGECTLELVALFALTYATMR